MARRKRFTDGAGYTRHCWECVHAKGWRKSLTFGGRIDPNVATCELTGQAVGKEDSPDNLCSQLGAGCDYDDGRSDG